MIDFTHLHCHSSIGSQLDAITNIDQMFARAAELGNKALALTDHGTLAGVFDARKASKKYGVKYIPGIEAYFVDDVSLKPDKKDPRTRRRHIVLLAKNEVGYKNLLQLNWKGFQNNQYIGFINKIFPRIDWKMLEEHHEGIICLTACGSGLISREMFLHDEDGEWLKPTCHVNIKNVIQKLKVIFGKDLYLEVQPHNLKIVAKDKKTFEPILNKNGQEIVIVDQNYINNILISFARELDVSLVATADIHYLNKSDAKIHDMLMAISEKAPLTDKNRHRYEVEEFYFKTGQEVYNHFLTYFNDEKLAEEVCFNTVKIAEKCVDPTYLDTTATRFPKFNVSLEPDYEKFNIWHEEQFKKNKKEIPLEHSYMRYKCIEAFNEKFNHLKGKDKKTYINRIMKEIEVLEYHNFSSYMLIVSDYIKKARLNNIAIGPGRGSVCGSLVAYLLEIHDVDPIEYGLLFERFHNKEKSSFPDIDTDIHPDGRAWVQQYIVDKYGKEKVAHVSNLSTMTPKVVVKDIARSLELGGSKSKAFQIANKITDSIPNDAKTFEDALNKSEEFRKYCEQFPELEAYGKKLVGLERAYATHAAGLVIGDIDLSTYVPLRVDKDGAVSIQYEKERCESLGLIKMDLLGLEHLKIIDNAIRNAKQLGHNPTDCNKLSPYNDQEVWEDISKGKTMCVFQMGSTHMRALCKQIQPKNIKDLSLVNALGRPSAVKSRNSYIARRNNSEKVTYKLECLKASLQETLGICVYEEQLAKLASTVSGWDGNKADGLRKLTKLKGKHPELVIQIKQDFIKGAMEHSKISEDEALFIWTNIIEPFEGYGFNQTLHFTEIIDVFSKNEQFLDQMTIQEIFENKNTTEMYVKSKDEKTKEDIFVKINDVYDHGEIDVYEFNFSNGKSVKCTMEHKFRVEDGRMLPIKQIIEEDLDVVCIKDMAKITSYNYLGKHQTYDLEVDHEDHQFYLHSGLLTSNSHGVAYSINGYNSAYYFHHYPAAYMAAVLESESSKSSSPVRDANIQEYKKEIKRLKISIKPPDINYSSYSFVVADDATIITGLSAIKGLGDKAVQEILTVRKQHPFKSFQDFLLRTSSTLIRKDVIGALAKAGCFDGLNITRKNAHDNYALYRTAANAHAKKVVAEGRYAWDILDDFVVPEKINKDEWDKTDIANGERETLGEVISVSLNDLYGGFFTGKQITPLSRLKTLSNGITFKTESIVSNIKQNKLTKGKNAGKVYVKCMLSDIDGNTAEMTVWPEQWMKYKNILDVGKPIRAICKVNTWNNSNSLVLERLE